MATLTQDQITALQALLQGLQTLQGSVGAAPAKTSAKKVKDPNAPKRKPHAVIEEQKKVYADMKAKYRADHGIGDDTDDAAIRKMVKDGTLSDPYPSYPDALKEYSRIRSQTDPEHEKKAKAYRDRIDAKQALKKETKKSTKTSEASSVVTADETEVAAPAPAPVVEDKKSTKPKKINITVKKNQPPPYEITTISESDDPNEWNKMLTLDGKKYAMNGMNHLCQMSEDGSGDADWVGIWNPVTHKIEYCDPPEDEGDGEGDD